MPSGAIKVVCGVKVRGPPDVAGGVPVAPEVAGEEVLAVFADGDAPDDLAPSTFNQRLDLR